MASSGGSGSGPGKRDPFLLKGINEQKLKSFSIGSMGRRGPTRKEQEEMRKKKADEEEVGKVYAEFVSSFQSGGSGSASGSGSGSKTWIKAGTFNAGSRSEDSTGKGQIYNPVSRIQPKTAAEPSPSTPKTTENRRPERPGSKKKEKEKKKSNLEAFKEELKARQEERQERHRFKHVIRSVEGSRDQVKEDKEEIMKPFLSDPASGSHDNGDPNTTNVYLGNLSPKLTEQELMELFGKYGPLASIKIMWPRTEDEKARGRNCGFVAYMSRKDAERAMKYLLGKMIDGFEMKMGWGKPVPLPLHPIYIPPSMLKLTVPPEPTNLPFNCQLASEADKEKAKDLDQNSGDPFFRLLRRGVVRVTIPSDRTQLCLINRMAEFVIREGPMFEAMIMNREINNRMFRFLFGNQSPEHVYYRWRLFSLLQGDSKDDWRTDEFRMFKGGSVWKPPTIGIFTQGMPDHLVSEDPKEEGQKKEIKKKKNLPDKGGLSDSQRDRFEDMLRNLLPDRNPIAETMVWCIEHAEAGEEIVDCISESLSIDKTPLAKKIARLYLISDILHNCSVKGVPNVSYYRKGFQAKLPEIFTDLNICFKSIEGRIRAESFRQRVLGCFRAWEDWALYPQDFLIRLQNIFLGLVNDKNGGDSEDSKDDVVNSEDEDVDGIPLDGAALLKKARKSAGPDAEPVLRTAKHLPSGFAPSRWETVDQKTVEAQAVTSKWELFDQNDEKKRKSDEDDDDDIDGVPLDEGSAGQLSVGISEDRRARLREIEVKVMGFQDELESGKVSSKPGWTISEQVEQYRRMLINSDRRGEVDGRGRRRSRSSSSSSRSSSGSGRDRWKRRKKRDDSSGSDSSGRYSRSSRSSHKKRKR